MRRQRSSVSPSSALRTALRQQREMLEEIRSQQRALRAALDRLFDSLSKRIDEYEQHMMLRFSEVDALLRAATAELPERTESNLERSRYDTRFEDRVTALEKRPG